MAAIVAVPAADVVSVLDRARQQFYAGLVERDPTQERFLAGWLNQVAATTMAASGMPA